eukprot:PhF_6_TR7029/c0_g2_i1/m.10529
MDTLVQDILPYARNEYFLPQITISLRMQHKRDREHLTLQVSNTFTGRDIKRIAVQHSEKGPHDVAAIIDVKRLRVFAMGKRKYTFSQMAELYDDETIEELSCVPSVDALQFYVIWVSLPGMLTKPMPSVYIKSHHRTYCWDVP